MNQIDGSDLEQNRKMRNDRIASLKEKKSGFEKQITTYENHLANLAANGDLIKSKILEKRGEISVLRHKCQDAENEIKRLDNKSTDKLDLFGADTRRLVEAVKKNQKKFKSRPIGPIGLEIKLRDGISPEVAAMIENELSDILGAFIVDNFDDKKTLDTLQESLKTQSRVIKSGCGFQHRKYDVSPGRCFHENFSTIYDYLLSEHDVVMNTLVDLKSVEQVILIPTDEEAQGIMSNSSKVPAKCKYALTISGYMYYPAPNYRTYASAADGQSQKSRILQSSIKQVIEGWQSELANLKTESNCAENELKKLKLEMEQNESEIIAEKRCKKEIHSKVFDVDSDIRKLITENDIEKLPNISALEEDAEKASDDIFNLVSRMEENNKRLEEAECDLAAAQTQYNCCLERRSNIREKGQHLQDSYKERQEVIDKLQQELDHYESKGDEYREELIQSRAKEEREEGEIEDLRKKAKSILAAPPSADQLRRPEAIFREIESLEKSLVTQRVNLEPLEIVIRNLRRSKAIYNSKKIKVNRLIRNVKKLTKMLSVREEGFGLIQASVGRRVQHSFNVRMGARNYRFVISRPNKLGWELARRTVVDVVALVTRLRYKWDYNLAKI